MRLAREISGREWHFVADFHGLRWLGQIELLPTLRLQILPAWTKRIDDGRVRDHYGVGIGWLNLWAHLAWTSHWHAPAKEAA